MRSLFSPSVGAHFSESHPQFPFLQFLKESPGGHHDILGGCKHGVCHWVRGGEGCSDNDVHRMPWSGNALVKMKNPLPLKNGQSEIGEPGIKQDWSNTENALPPKYWQLAAQDV